MVGTRPVDAYFARAKKSTHQKEAHSSPSFFARVGRTLAEALVRNAKRPPLNGTHMIAP